MVFVPVGLQLAALLAPIWSGLGIFGIIFTVPILAISLLAFLGILVRVWKDRSLRNQLFGSYLFLPVILAMGILSNRLHARLHPESTLAENEKNLPPEDLARVQACMAEFGGPFEHYHLVEVYGSVPKEGGGYTDLISDDFADKVSLPRGTQKPHAWYIVPRILHTPYRDRDIPGSYESQLNMGVKLLPGVEMSTVIRADSIHSIRRDEEYSFPKRMSSIYIERKLYYSPTFKEAWNIVPFSNPPDVMINDIPGLHKIEPKEDFKDEGGGVSIACWPRRSV